MPADGLGEQERQREDRANQGEEDRHCDDQDH
jgi:hypothetical protein